MSIKSIIESTDALLMESINPKDFGELRSILAEDTMDLEKLDALLLKLGKDKRTFEEVVVPYFDDIAKDRGDMDGLKASHTGLINVNNDDHDEAYLYVVDGSYQGYDEGFDMIDGANEELNDEYETLEECVRAMEGNSYTAHSESGGFYTELSGSEVIVTFTEKPFLRGGAHRVDHYYRIGRSNGADMTRFESNELRRL